MKKLILSVFIVFILLSCEKEVHITNPTIITKPVVARTLDTLQHEVIAEAEIDGVIVEIEKFEWSIIDDKGDSVQIIYQEDNVMKWLPLRPGAFQVEVTLVVGNKSMKEIDIINVEYYGLNVWKKLSGKWHTRGAIADDTEWVSTFKIEDNGIFSASINEVIKGNVISSLGKVGNDSIPSKSINYFGRFTILGSNYYNGKIRYYYGDVTEPKIANDQITSMVFLEDFNKVEMEIVFTDFLNSEAPHEKYTVNYEMTKIE